MNDAAVTGWFTLAGALGGVLLTSVFTFVTARYRAREETRRELFAERRRVYAATIVELTRILTQLAELSGVGRAGYDEEEERQARLAGPALTAAVSGPLVVAGPEVREVLPRVMDAFLADMRVLFDPDYEPREFEPSAGAAFDELEAAMRRELGVHD